MTRLLPLVSMAAFALIGFTSCVEPEKKPVGPQSQNSQIPWNTPIAGQGQGQLGMMPQNQYRR